MEPIATTERLVLRTWTQEDLAPFSALNGDPQTMRFFPSTLDRRESDALAGRIRSEMERLGFGLWALERRSDGCFLGYTGLWVPSYEAAFTPCVEIGWRLHRHHWGQGYATEAARAALDLGFRRFGLGQVVSMTAKLNQPSIRVMERIGMSRDPGLDFDHPKIAPGHPLSPHVLYRIRAPLSPTGGTQPIEGLRILEDDLSSPGAQELLRLHLQGMYASSPAGTVFALDTRGLRAPGVTVWTAWAGPNIAGMGALKDLGDGWSELKSMRTHPFFLRRGVAAAILETIIAAARARGLSRLSLETGTGPSFEPALALYRARGFKGGGPFGDYVPSPFNQFMHLDL